MVRAVFLNSIISGIVIKGLGLGKKLGLPPTMNLRVLNRRGRSSEFPKNLKHGIYAVRVRTSVGNFNGVMHFGPRPAVKAPLSLEVHCFGLKRKMYRRKINIEIVKKIRPVKNFKTVADLKKAIANDIAEAKKIL